MKILGSIYLLEESLQSVVKRYEKELRKLDSCVSSGDSLFKFYVKWQVDVEGLFDGLKDLIDIKKRRTNDSDDYILYLKDFDFGLLNDVVARKNASGSNRQPRIDSRCTSVYEQEHPVRRNLRRNQMESVL